MNRKVLLLLGGFALTLLVSGRAMAGSKDFVVCLPLGEGSSTLATRHMSPFLRHVEKLVGWKSNAIKGKYLNSVSTCEAHVKASKPGFAVLSQGLYLDKRRAWRLKVIGRVDMPRGAGRRLYLVVKKGRYSSLSDLKGKVLKSNHVAEKKFLSKVVFKGKIDVESHFKLRPTTSPLRGFKSVYRGRADATLVNEEELKLMRRRKEGKQLEVIYKSPKLPGTPVVAFRRNASSKDIRTLKKALPGLCKGVGASVCRGAMIKDFDAASQSTYRKLIRLFR